VAYLDNTDSNREKRQEGDIVFTAPTDRVYLDTTHEVTIVDPVLRRRIVLTKENSRTTVVWNPWSTGAKALSDLGDEEWRSMACAEASNIRASTLDLGPGEQHVMNITVRVLKAG
jgi:glucose-6-phosphate 1-epimerase